MYVAAHPCCNKSLSSEEFASSTKEFVNLGEVAV